MVESWLNVLMMHAIDARCTYMYDGEDYLCSIVKLNYMRQNSTKQQDEQQSKTSQPSFWKYGTANGLKPTRHQATN